jgi:outer membrane biosynthesis protein TonB
MKIANLTLGLGLLTASAVLAQGPLYDKVTVTLPYPVTVNGTVLQPGDYVIRQHDDAGGGSRVLHFFTDDGMKLETTAMAIPALENRTQEHTRLVLDHIGSEYYLNKIWVQGKDYGYEFPIPPDVRMREQERNAPTTVAAQYTPAPAPEPQVAVTETKKEEETTVVAQNNTPPPAPEVQPTPAPEPAPEPLTPRVQADQTPEPAPVMPHTAANWMNLILGGGLLAASGLALRRVRA